MHRLNNVLNTAYRHNVLGHKGMNPHGTFAEHARDPEFIATARAELGRLQAVPELQCFASAQHRRFLEQVIAAFDAKQKEIPDHAAD